MGVVGFGGFAAAVAFSVADALSAGLYGLAVVAGLVVVVLVAAAVAFVPAMLAAGTYRARQLVYVDTGIARAALSLKDLGDGEFKAHTLGAWPKGSGAGTALGEWTRNEIHAVGGRLVGYALRGIADTYCRHGMVVDRRTCGGLIVRLVSN